MSKLMKTSQVAEMLSVSNRTVQNWCKSGTIKAVKVGSLYRISEEDLEEFLNRNTTKTENESEENSEKFY